MSPARSCHSFPTNLAFKDQLLVTLKQFLKRRGKKTTQKGNSVNGEHSQTGINLGPDVPNMVFFHPDLIWCCPIASQRATEWGQ